MDYSTGPDDRQVETTLREILDPLDRQLAWVSVLFPLALVTVVPVFFFVLWLWLEMTGKRALVMSVGPFCALVALNLILEIWASRLALRRFDRRFPPGSPERLAALQILNEMQTPSKAEEKLHVALASASVDRIVRHRRESTDLMPGHLRIDTPSEASPPHTDVPLKDASTVASNARTGPGPGGYYNYIPLEPRSCDPEQSEQA